ncbi:MAG: TIGR02757 family protein [Vicinamibacteria bacterium]
MRQRDDELRRRLDALYLQYDHRFVDPDPLQFVRAHEDPADREVVGLVASALAYGNVLQIKKSIAAALLALGSRPAEAIRRRDPSAAGGRLAAFKHRFNDGRDVACLFFYLRQMIEASGSVEAFFASGDDPSAADVAPGLASFAARALDLDHGGLYGRGPLPAKAGVRFFFPSPASGSACKRLNLYLRWMVRSDSVDLGTWTRIDRSRLVIPLDAHVYAIARKARLTRYKSPGWAMAVDLTARLRRLDPADPVKYDFAFHRMGLFKKAGEIRSLREVS